LTPPIRSCIGCGRKAPQQELLRFVAENGRLVPGDHRPVADGGAVWVHYGANLGAAGGQLSLVSPADDLRELAFTELAGAGQPIQDQTGRTAR